MRFLGRKARGFGPNQKAPKWEALRRDCVRGDDSVAFYVPLLEYPHGYAASHRAVAKLKTHGILPRRVQVRSCKYLNNVIEQDHRRIKQRIRPMLGFKRFETAAVTIRGIELAEKIKKQQFNLKTLTGKATTALEMWAVVLAA